MGNLEKTLAEIEVLASEVTHRHILLPYVDMDKSLELEKAITGVENDARLAYNQCNETYRFLRKKDDLSASSAFSQMALDLKNLADNLNIALQTLYGNYVENLKALEQNTATAPNTPGGKSLYQRFTETHNSSRTSPLMVARNCKGHNMGHNILFRTPVGSGWPKDKPYYLALPRENGNVTETRFLSKEDIESLALDYLEMTRDILQTVANNDSLGLAERKASRGLNTKIQRTKNFFKRHSKPLAFTAASVLLTAGAVGGSIGTVAYQNYKRQKEMQETLKKVDRIVDIEAGYEQSADFWAYAIYRDEKANLYERRRQSLQKLLIDNPCYSPSYDLGKVFGTSSNLFTEAIVVLNSNSQTLGKYIDNYLSRASMGPSEVTGKTAEFLQQRESFLKRANSFVLSQKGNSPSYESLVELRKLSQEQEALSDLESDIYSFFPRLK